MAPVRKPKSASAANIRKLQPPVAPKSAASAAAKAMASKSEPAMAVGVARQLAYGTDSDRAQLRAIVENLSPQAKSNLMVSIAGEMRDPRSTAKAISLTQEGNELVGIIFRGEQPSPERLAEIARVGEGASPRLANIPATEDLSPKGPPQAPKGESKRKIQDQPRFRSKERIVEGKDGELKVKHSSVTLDRDTKRAIDRAKKGERVGQIYDDPANAPNGAPSGALRSGTRTPLQEYTQRLNRLAGLRDPSQGTHAGSVVSDEMGAEVPMSVFMPSIPNSPAGGSMATVRPQDYSDAMRLFQQVRRGDNRVPNTQYNSPEEMARELVAQAHQGGYDATPVTASQRADATALVSDLADNPEDITPAAAGKTVRTYMPEQAKATSVAQRAVVQEQVIQSLARKLQEVFGHEGWGGDYKPSARPASAEPAAPPGGVGEGVASSGYEPAGIAPKNPNLPGRPGMELDPELDAEDLTDLDTRKRFAEEGGESGQPLPDGEAESVVTRGSKQGDRLGVGPSKRSEPGGNKTGEYEDDASFAEHNRRNRTVSEGDLDRRQSFYDQWNKAMEMESGRTSDLRKQLDDLLAQPTAPGTRSAAAHASQVAELQRRIRLAERLDNMSGINSMETGPSPADLGKNKLDASTSLIDRPTPVVDAHPFDLDGKPRNPNEPIDVEFEVKREPEIPEAEPPKRISGPTSTDQTKTIDAPAPAKKDKWPWWKKIAAGAGILTGGLTGYEMLRRAGQPPAPPFGPNDMGGGGGGPVGPDGFPWIYSPPGESATGQDLGAAPADRIRALQNFQMRLNPHTQTLTNWTE